MQILYLLIPLSLLLLGTALAGLVWAVRKGQYDDLDSPAHKILYDDDLDKMPKKKDSDKHD
ncbi:cbb3-type cytochrome oxidase assembly protein CcoS [Gynuella sp.]|uniref:cbb3-type cytochrome oxidase assembly protein CcoS n=1 Tax=Gynuella sp. TaxID=2969146 RepID=UPI003D0F5B1F